jgi:hypothetical protein
MWSQDVLDVFFENAFEKLEGERPNYGPAGAKAAPQDSVREDTPEGIGTWSRLIDADTIETEIKRLAQVVAADVTTPGAFKGGAYKACRRTFSLLAVLFAVAGEYDGDVRWHDAAPGLREAFARAGRNCRVGTDQTYQEATRRKQELADLVTGARPQSPAAERKANWAEVSDRPPLMQRLNIAQQERLTKWLANERTFKAHAEDVRHEAQVVAMLAGVIAREGFDYWDDEQFSAYAKELEQAATEMSSAVELGDYQTAREAGTRMTKACADCHEGYRG